MVRARGHWGRGALVLGALGATLGAALDGIHSWGGATVYAHPVALRAAWWVPLLFGAAFGIGLIRPALERVLDDVRPPPDGRRTLLAMLLFCAAYALSVLPLPWQAVAALLAALFAAGWWWCDRSGLGLAIAALAAVGGPLFESLLVSRGAFAYLHPAYFGISGWLPSLYLCAAVGLCSLGKRLVDG